MIFLKVPYSKRLKVKWKPSHCFKRDKRNCLACLHLPLSADQWEILKFFLIPKLWIFFIGTIQTFLSVADVSEQFTEFECKGEGKVQEIAKDNSCCIRQVSPWRARIVECYFGLQASLNTFIHFIPLCHNELREDKLESFVSLLAHSSHKTVTTKLSWAWPRITWKFFPHQVCSGNPSAAEALLSLQKSAEDWSGSIHLLSAVTSLLCQSPK